MKSLLYIIYSVLFTLSRKLFNFNEKKIVIFATHDRYLSGNMGYIISELKIRQIECKLYVFKYYDRNLSLLENIKRVFKNITILIYHMPTAGTVILDNIFIASAYFKFHQKAKVVQVWHSAGVFKKFGLHACDDNKLAELQKRANKNLTHVIIDSFRNIDIVSEAFGVDPSIVLPIGSPRTDLLFNPSSIKRAKIEFNKRYPDTLNKKKVLYAPTFREFELREKGFKGELSIDLKLLKEQLGNEYIILIRLHPRVRKRLKIHREFEDFVYDVSNYKNLDDLIAAADVLITDYSSVFIEFAALMKPIIFFPYDLERYQSQERGFYFNYSDWVPGPIVFDNESLLRALFSAKVDEKQEEFVNRQFDFRDGNASARFVSKVLNNEE